MGGPTQTKKAPRLPDLVATGLISWLGVEEAYRLLVLLASALLAITCSLTGLGCSLLKVTPLPLTKTVIRRNRRLLRRVLVLLVGSLRNCPYDQQFL